MSFDEYAEHLYQKHRLIVAIAIIKSKPSERTAIEFLNQLKSKMVDNTVDNMADDDATVCSDDFIMDYDDDSITILKDFGDEFMNDASCEDSLGNSRREQVLNNQHPNYSQNTFYDVPQDIYKTTHQNMNDTSTPQDLPLNSCTDKDTTHHDNVQNTLQNLDEIEPNSIANNVKPYNITNILENEEFVVKRDATPNKIDRKQTNSEINLNNTVGNINNNKVANNLINNNENNTQLTNTDSQKTILYTVHGYIQNYTHYSPSQTEIFVPKTHLYGDKRNIFINTDENINKSENLANINSNATNIDQNTIKYPEKDRIYDKNAMTVNTIDEIAATNTVINDPVTTQASTDIELENIYKTTLYSQEFDDILNQYTSEAHSIVKSHQNENKQIDVSNMKILENSQNIDDIFVENQLQATENVKLTQFNYLNNKENCQNTSQSFENINYYNNTDSQRTNCESNQTFENENSLKDVPQNQNIKNLTQDFGPNNDTSQNIRREEVYTSEEEELVEVIPYKVLEELNKVKSFLRRKERRMSSDSYSSDSGYKSDSQIRSSNRSALQLSGISINQSAYCLFNHLMVSPLIHATRDITTEIAQTLAELINKLHEEESYPPFLEELLNTVDILLRQVYKGQNVDDVEFLKKEEFIQRLLLLNKSLHIQEHTIEKISNILTNFHQKVTDKDVTYELININEMENLSYIFHLLEILIKKYVQIKDVSHGNTETSQDDERILKKSSITDIWRKKWNPNLKISEGSRENRCVLKNCSEILNKLVVECVTSYSLVAFSALRCFNCIQS